MMAARSGLAIALLMLAMPGVVHARAAAKPPPELFYHIFVRSFADSNADHNGDLNGIRQRLGYLQRLGVTTIMLTPLYPSHFYHNYFADDFAGIDRQFGTMKDFALLVKAVHARGMKIVLDEEIQYVTGLHQWRRASAANPASPAANFLLYDDAARHHPAATLTGSSDFWVWPNQHQQIFTVNLLDPEVNAYFLNYLKSRIDPGGNGDLAAGVDGFRIDHMMDDLDNKGRLTDLMRRFWAPLIARLRQTNPRLRFIAEQADWGDGATALADGGVDMVFAFPIWKAAAKLDANRFAAAIDRSNAIIRDGHSQLVFIENHDTPRFADRLPKRAEILRLGAAITMLSGWIPSIYYGQEIGMSGGPRDDRTAPAGAANSDARDIPQRQAFRWAAKPTAADNADWYRQFPGAYQLPDSNVPGDGVSVAEQAGKRGSLLTTYRALARLRARYRALADGSTRLVAQRGDLVLISRHSDGGDALVLFNFSPRKAIGRFSLPRGAVRRWGPGRLLGHGGVSRIGTQPYSATVWTFNSG